MTPMQIGVEHEASPPPDILVRRLVVTLVATGWADDDIAVVARIPPRTLAVFKRSELFERLVVEMRTAIHALTARTGRERLRALHHSAVSVLDMYLCGKGDMAGRAHDLRAAIEVNRSIVGRPAPEQPVSDRPPSIPQADLLALHRALRPVIEVTSERIAEPAMPKGIRGRDEIAADCDE